LASSQSKLLVWLKRRQPVEGGGALLVGKAELIFLVFSSQSGCFDPLPQNFPPQQPTATPVSMDPKLPTYPSQFTPAQQAQFTPELATVGPQGLGFGAPQGAFPGGNTNMGLRPGMTRPQGMGPQLRLPPNQLRLQLQQRLQGPQQVNRDMLYKTC